MSNIISWRNNKSHYGTLSISLHWLMLVLLVAVYGCIELREFFPRGSDVREALKTWHFMIGLSVLALVFVRWGINVAGPFPLIKPAPPSWLAKPAILMHLLLYAFMILMPLLGWLILSAEGKPIPFFGLQLPALMEPSKDLAGFIQEVHEVGGTVGYFLIGLHTVAALFHHIFLKDNTIKRMLFSRA